MIKKYLLALGLSSLALPVLVLATTPVMTGTEDLSAFRSYKEFTATGIVVPTVVEIPIDPGVSSRGSFRVLSQGSSVALVPSLFRQTKTRDFTLSITATNANNDTNNMIDGSQSNFTEFLLPADRSGNARIIISSSKPTTLDRLTFLLAGNTALPTSIEVKKVNGDQEVIVLASSRMTGETVLFPSNTSVRWVIDLTYAQPLYISEILVDPFGAQVTSGEYIRFLAQPNQSYKIYFNADHYVYVDTREMPDLVTDQGIKKIPALPTIANPLFKPVDIDKDGVIDRVDNCISYSNPDQKDIDANGRGDACDDFDRDGRINSQDNCIDQPNANQIDIDGDEIGDVCDPDESRLTEKYPILPWLGIGFAALVVIVLFALSFHRKPPTTVIS